MIASLQRIKFPSYNLLYFKLSVILSLLLKFAKQKLKKKIIFRKIINYNLYTIYELWVDLRAFWNLNISTHCYRLLDQYKTLWNLKDVLQSAPLIWPKIKISQNMGIGMLHIKLNVYSFSMSVFSKRAWNVFGITS